MKAFLYTLVLAAVLVVAVVFLYSLSRRASTGASRDTRMARPRAPMTVKSEPVTLGEMDRTGIDDSNRDALYQTGAELLDLWHLPEAIGIFEAVVELDTTHVAGYCKLIECYSHPIIGQERNARSAYLKAMEAARQSGGDTLWVSAVGSLFIEHNYAGAIDKFKDFEKHYGANDDLLFFLGQGYFQAGAVAQAERYLGDLLDRDPSLGRAKELFVRCMVARGELGVAESTARDIASMYPEEPYPYVFLSQVLMLSGRVEEAVEFGNNALRLDEKYIPAIVSRAHLYVAEQKPWAARVSFEKLLLFDEQAVRAVGSEGIAYVGFLTGRFDQASLDMDEAIRQAMNIGSTRRGLVYAFRLIDYLCELGRTESARAVLDRWVTRFGDIPTRLGQLRIVISEGDISSVGYMLQKIKMDESWLSWMKALRLDYVDIQALTMIKEKDFAGAVDLLDKAPQPSISGGRRDYLMGYATFENGGAEQAAVHFERARSRLHGLEFPFHSDPVLYVQSVFFLAEAAVARGESADAIQFYTEFLGLWGNPDWEVKAVERAKNKLETLSKTAVGG
ncbi:MAG: hypothetical protein JSW50_13090 [Candidatus Latescibacterota bacterium]|nr:MAG: hypothetical protein JSW50_13090 [Candidatus Latescibacterota bacterium]